MIPERVHFIWIGSRLPYIFRLSVLSALRRSQIDRVVFHHTDALEPALRPPPGEAKDRLELRRIAPEALLEGIAGLGGELVDLYRRLERPASRANVLRAAILHREGGVYLDTDVITVQSLLPLLADGVFCGREPIIFPHAEAKRRRTARGYLRGLALGRLRGALRLLPRGYLLFRKVQHLYVEAVNNAVLGARAAHPLIDELLRRMTTLPRQEQTARYALGTHLLQRVAAEYGGSDLVVHPPDAFYPLGPEISTHWFRRTPRARQRLAGELLSPRTRAVHWYASVRTRHLVERVGPDYIRQHAAVQPFSALVEAYA